MHDLSHTAPAPAVPALPALVRLLHVTNPLEPTLGRTLHELPHVDLAPVAHYLAAAGLAVAWDLGEVTVSLNGGLLDRERAAQVLPLPGDCLVVAPRVGSSGLIKTLGQVALIAGSIALIASGAGAGLGAFLGFSAATATAAGNSILVSALNLGGNLLIGAIASLLTPAAKPASSSYAPTGPRSTAQSGVVIPKGYGKMRWGGNIISSFVDVAGQDQYINALVCFGFGPARSITDIEVNGKPIAEYQNVQVYTRLGANRQTPLPNFNRVTNVYPQQSQCLAGIPVTVPGTGDLTDITQVDIQFPDGAYVHTNDGNFIPILISYLVETSLSGSGVWDASLFPMTTQDVVTYDANGKPLPYSTWVALATDLPPSSGVVYAADNGPHSPGDPWTGTVPITTYSANGSSSNANKACRGEWQLFDPTLNLVEVTAWSSGYVNYTWTSTQVLYNRTTIYHPSRGRWDVRVTKYGSVRLHTLPIPPGDNFSPSVGQDVWISSVNEVTSLDLSYPNMILIGVRALSTSQISGSNLNVTALVEHGLRTLDNNVLPARLQQFEESNPACVAADMMLDRLYGGGDWPGVQPANLDRYIDQWVAWAELNDQLVDDGNGGSIRRHVFNGVFDSDSDLWSALNTVGQMSRAQVLQVGRDYSVFVDGPDTPVQLFSMGNLSADSFSEVWLELDARANQIEIQFADSTRYYRSDNPIVYMDPTAQDAGVAVKNTRINGKGITLPAQAWHLARYRERSNQLLLRTGSFSAPISAVACRAGNLVLLQHDVPQWGIGGRTLPGSTATALRLDRTDAALTPGTPSSVVLLHPALERYTGTVTGTLVVIDSTGLVIGTQLTLSNFDNALRVTRAVLYASATPGLVGTDCVVKASAPGQVLILPAAGFTPAVGMPYALWDTDVLETRAVAGITLLDGVQSLLLAAPLTAAPQDFSTYFFGTSTAQKIVRINKVSRAGEFRMKLEWIDYDPDLYLDATPTIGEVSAIARTNPGVTSLTGRVTFAQVAGSYVPSVSLAWQLGPDTVGVGIYLVPAAVAGGGVGPTMIPQPALIARLTGYPTSWSQPAPVGQTLTYIVVGFDLNDNYASIVSAPRVTLAIQGIAKNLLLGSSFESGFTYWNLFPRPGAGDTFVPTLGDDGEATWSNLFQPLTGKTTLLEQLVPASKWTVGQSLMLSGYAQDLAAYGLNAGNIGFTINFYGPNYTLLSSATANLAMPSPNLTRVNTAATVIPAGTVSLGVSVSVTSSAAAGAPPIEPGAQITLSHLLLEIVPPIQTQPSEWAAIDAAGHIQDLFTTGSSAGLRVQGSLLPSFSGQFAQVLNDTSVVLSWTGLTISWPDGGFSYVPDGSYTVTGLKVSTTYWVFLYYDVVMGGLRVGLPSAPVGSPGYFALGYDATADNACRIDGRVPLTPLGMTFSTSAAGQSTTGAGGGNFGGVGANFAGNNGSTLLSGGGGNHGKGPNPN